MFKPAHISVHAALGIGLCAAALTLGAQASADPLSTGGYHCVEAVGADGAPCAVPPRQSPTTRPPLTDRRSNRRPYRHDDKGMT
ncbi:hypothetical protein [Mycolicibacterium insubricum]|uniref:hypothetical protein n=1 Tax=Mycolicibacterium insubricum TaxID=444597 RepID=UPI0021F3811A|nr:hypothetical protein [Mycolicibacterium insubricum]MCV7082667.1 hypothetical protein [Mycolicibacterium insubricum]